MNNLYRQFQVFMVLSIIGLSVLVYSTDNPIDKLQQSRLDTIELKSYLKEYDKLIDSTASLNTKLNSIEFVNPSYYDTLSKALDKGIEYKHNEARYLSKIKELKIKLNKSSKTRYVYIKESPTQYHIKYVSDDSSIKDTTIYKSFSYPVTYNKLDHE